MLPGADDDADSDTAIDTAVVEAAAAEHGIPVTVLELPEDGAEASVEGGVEQLRSRWGADLLLIRPDQHVAWRGGDVAAAAAALTRAAGW